MIAMLAALSSTASTCPSGESGYATLVGSTVRYAFDTARYGFLIGSQSDSCSLPISPSPQTFQIWNYIYSHQSIMLFPFYMTGEEMYHVSEANKATSTWLASFTGDDKDEDGNAKSLSAIETMECHIGKAMHIACESTPRPFACCSFSQYNTWLRIAKLLSKMIVKQYGNGRCGSKLVSDAEVKAEFANEAQALIASLPNDGINGEARRIAIATVGWALKGICESRNDDCASLVNTTSIQEEYAKVHAISDQYEITFATSLSCAPSMWES